MPQSQPSGFINRQRNFLCLSQTDADLTFFVSYDYQGIKTHAASAGNRLANPVNTHNLFVVTIVPEFFSLKISAFFTFFFYNFLNNSILY